MQKILLIDDKRDNLVILAALLKNLMPELTIISAQSGAEGIEKAKSGQPDVILLDIMMPDMDGYETCRRLTTDETTWHIPVILLTAIKTNTASRVKGLEMGANSFLTKPVDEGELVSQVRVALRIKQAEDSLRSERKALEALVYKRTIALQESEHKWRNVLVNTPQIGISIDTHAKITFANNHFLSLTGWSSNEIIGKDWFEMFIPEDIRDEIRKVFLESINKENAFGHSTHENEILTRDGNRLAISWSNVATKTLNGEIIDVTCLGVDITERVRAEQTLKETKTLLETAGRVAHFGGWSVNLADNKAKWSDEVAAIHEMPAGYSPPVSEGISFYTPEWQEKISRVFYDCASKGIPYDEEMEIITGKGKRIWVRATGQAVYDESGKIIKVEGSFQDINQQKQAENDLRKSEEKYRLLVENQTDMVVKVDPEGRFLFASPSYCRLFGKSEEELLGQTFIPFIHEDDRSATAEAMKTLYSPPHTAYMEQRALTTRGWRWLAWLDTAVLDEQGNIKEIIGAGRDITEHMQTESALKTSEQQIKFQEELLRNAPMITLFHDNDFNVIWHNKAFADATGLPAHKIVGKKCYAAMGRDEPCLNCPGILTLKTEKPHQAELTRSDPGSSSVSPKVWDIRSIPARNDAEELIGAIEIALDISERIKLNNQFMQAQKIESVGRLAGGIAHDFNNMLGVILGYSEMAMEILPPSDPAYAFLKEVLSAASRSRDITRQLLAFARKQTISPQVLDLNETVESMLKMLRRLIGENIDLTWKPCNSRCTVNMDPSQIDQILANLCVNAGDAIADVGEISIGTELAVIDQDCCAANPGFIPGNFIKLTVRDSGCGMDKKTLSLIFEPFFTTKSIGKGSGLGLATVYGIVQQNNGFIDVCSMPGEGSAFHIYLPCHNAAADLLSVTSAATVPSGHGELILIVEDESALLKISQIMLEKLNYKILAASTPSEGIQLAKEYGEQIKLLLTDVIMPEMSGRDLASILSKLIPDLKVLFMSGYTADVIAHHGVLDEGLQFIQKPFLATDLAFRIHQVLHGVRVKGS
ncbi:MAG: hypothetical protein ACD_39C01911G0002 [uncultured bacterium]|nr:MAG: hypothetical protein ACD_39C01911G0002 [uncultured bacterium]